MVHQEPGGEPAKKHFQHSWDFPGFCFSEGGGGRFIAACERPRPATIFTLVRGRSLGFFVNWLRSHCSGSRRRRECRRLSVSRVFALRDKAGAVSVTEKLVSWSLMRAACRVRPLPTFCVWHIIYPPTASLDNPHLFLCSVNRCPTSGRWPWRTARRAWGSRVTAPSWRLGANRLTRAMAAWSWRFSAVRLRGRPGEPSSWRRQWLCEWMEPRNPWCYSIG